LKICRYLIVIDDVWSMRGWEAIQSRLLENKCGSRVLVTTRTESVAKACSPATVSKEYIYHIKPLSQEYSRKLFLSRAFGSTYAECPSDVNEKAMESILRKCGGLPLAIVSIASVLAGYTSPESKEKWETVCKSMGSQMEMHPTLEGMS
jgi:disease resistance protein RPM1